MLRYVLYMYLFYLNSTSIYHCGAIMAYQIKWHRPKSIIHLSVLGQLSISEVITINEKLLELALIGTPPVHVINEIADDTGFPMDARRISQITTLNNDIFGQIILVNANQIVKLFANLVKVLAKIDIAFANSIDEAVQLIDS